MAHVQDEIRPSSFSSTSSHSSTSTSASSSSSSASHCNKSVQFSRFIKISFTYPGDEYDRSALEPAKLTFSEASELLELRCHWRKQMSERLAQQQQQQQQDDSDNSEDEVEPQEQDHRPSCCCESNDSDYSDSEDVNNNITLHINTLKSSSSAPCLQISTASPTEAGAPNSPPSPQQQRLGRHSHRPHHHRHLHSLLHPTNTPSSGILFTSPPCSPLLSPQDSCSNSSSEDEYDPSLSPQHPLAFSASNSQQQMQQQQQQQRLKRFGGSRDGLMHRHSHLDQSKVNVQCIAIA